MTAGTTSFAELVAQLDYAMFIVTTATNAERSGFHRARRIEPGHAP